MDTTEALRRVKRILPMLIEDVKTAIQSHAVMETTNAIVPSETKGLRSPFLETYGAVQTALALKFAMDLARLFDWSAGRKLKDQEKASVLVLSALLVRADVQAELEAAAIGCRSDVASLTGVTDAPLRSLASKRQAVSRNAFRTPLTDFFAAVERLNADGSPAKAALKRLRDFRTKRLAHVLFDDKPDPWPTYGDLHLLLEIAIEAVTAAALAIDGLNTSLDERAALDRANAEGFARCLVEGLKGAVVP